MNASAAEFMFLRPWWLLALAALPLLLWLHRRWQRDRGVWQRAVDAHLLPHLLQSGGGRDGRAVPIALAFGAALAIVALAGPSWRQLPARLWQQEAPLLIALDLSSAMRAADLPPSRLVQARYKLASLLQQRRGGQVGLLVFAGDAFEVAPITRDANTVRALLDSLAPDLMPVDGQRAGRAIGRAVAMLRSAGFERGEILLVTDHADSEAREAAAQAATQGFRVSALGVGTATGAPMTGAGGFVTGDDGHVKFARLDQASLAALAQAGGGRAAVLTADRADLDALNVLDPQGNATADPDPASGTGNSSSRANAGIQRTDDGYWLLLFALPLALFAFRRRGLAALASVALAGALLPAPALQAAPDEGAVAAPAAGGTGSFDWEALWQRDDQRARAAFDGGDVARARELAPDPALRGAAAYRGEDYAAAAQAWAAGDDADMHYNRGNALAMAGRLEDALTAYDAALARHPGMDDALANRKAVEELLKQQQSRPQQSQDGQSRDQQSQDQRSQGQQSQDQQSQDQRSQGQPSQDQQSQDQQSRNQPPPGQQSQDQDSKERQSDPQSAQQQPSSGDPAEPADQPAGTAADAAAQEQAREAARREMEQALAREGAPGEESADRDASEPELAQMSPQERAEAERRQALQQWLRRVPDDPGGLLRRKFELEYRRRQAEGDPP